MSTSFARKVKRQNRPSVKHNKRLLKKLLAKKRLHEEAQKQVLKSLPAGAAG